MNRAYALPVAAIVLAALSACPSPSDTRDPWPTPTPVVTQEPPTSPATSPQTVQPTRRATTPPPTRRATVRPTTAAPTTGEADPTEPVTGADYANCEELRHDYPGGVPVGHPAYESRLDRDNDGQACGPTGDN